MHKARLFVQRTELTAATSILARIERKSRAMKDWGGADSSPPSSAYVEHVVRASGTSFYWAMRFLPAEKRQAMFAIYAFCRQVDDIADEPGEMDSKQQALGGWREDIERLYDGIAGGPITSALVRPVASFALPKQDFLAVIDGMEMDAADCIRIADCDELRRYCDRVACAVGRLSVRIFGVPQPTGDLLASALGEALQLTNILRDLKEDARRDRLYLPVDLLRKHGVFVDSDANAILHNTGIADICEELAAMAALKFEEASALLAQCNRGQVRPAVIMMEVYRRTFERLNGRGWRRWAEPVAVPSAEKLWIALRYGMM
jgi:presqualene diphosphate synthase